MCVRGLWIYLINAELGFARHCYVKQWRRKFYGTTKMTYGLDSVVGIATRYRLDGLGLEPRRGEIFGAFHTGLEAHPVSCTMGTVSFLGLKRLERGADRPPSSSATLRMTWSYTSVRLLCLHRRVMGWPLPLHKWMHASKQGWFWIFISSFIHPVILDWLSSQPLCDREKKELVFVNFNHSVLS
jgi:hypothetical protein